MQKKLSVDKFSINLVAERLHINYNTFRCIIGMSQILWRSAKLLLTLQKCMTALGLTAVQWHHFAFRYHNIRQRPQAKMQIKPEKR